MRRIPGFDQVVRALFGLFGERAVRLAFQANAIRVSERQFSQVYSRYRAVLATLDGPAYYGLFLSQTPIVNAGGYGMNRPFIILNSDALRLLGIRS